MKVLRDYSKEKALKIINHNKSIKEFYDSIMSYKNIPMEYVIPSVDCSGVINDKGITYYWTDYKGIERYCSTIHIERAIVHLYYIRKYNGRVKRETYHWMSNVTGELQKNIFHLIREIFYTKKHYGFWNLKWKYSRKGF